MKAESEQAIRSLCWDWAKARGLPLPPDGAFHYSFGDFKSWLGENGYSHYLNFRATPSADYVAELWFDQEFKQSWRN